MEGFEVFVARTGPDGTYTLIDLKPGQWYFAFEQPDKAPTIVGPITLVRGESARKVDLAAVEGGAIEGRVTNVPDAMRGRLI